MKKWYLLAGLVVVYLAWRWVKSKRIADAAAATADQRDAAIAATINNLAAQSLAPALPDGTVVTWTQPDQSKYPGWYLRSDGTWVNPDTGVEISPGGSPPVVDNYDRTQHEVQIDLNNGFDFAAAGTDTSLGGNDIIF